MPEEKANVINSEILFDTDSVCVKTDRYNELISAERSFYQDNKIYALHQGADNKNKEKATYLGDSFVIVDKEKVNIQIHKIVPKRKTVDGNVIESDYTQFMFAVYIPKAKKYFMKG